ncbi:uncharacterized protein OCT59_013518 [Rhizophagus irregularis]|uniref:MIR domain-containing protein n=3 Tax=Rhizophagus irregularis TaxID=588596 RepID=A0A015J3S4_RHIIW|nr:hypothetical protein RirG_145730 [Rhizophagus irregularis DAOM 197198w]UZO21117.1 hypothetical protein OCT59_013518 [Rhizophagus irregularis]GBC45625.1 hypothetical protein GLOIN_2v620017 [Rhizophagus irregularis DAOM 181602=DAOM 197198]
MELIKYDETIHPEVWLNTIKLYCYKNQITKKEDIIEFCKSMIHPSINVSKANTFEEILNTLKNDIFFISFKHSVKKKLQKLKFDPKNKNYIQLINIFREYCYEAEINVEEQKKLLLEKLSEDSFQYYFINDNLEKIKSLNDLIIYFNQSFLEQQKLIRFGSCITLKHVATGKYLTSCNVHYKTGSKRSIVFASQTLSNPNSLWIVLDYDQKNESNPIIYGKSIVYFLNKGVNENIVISRNYKSPSTGNWEVSCTREIYEHLIESDSTNNNDTYIKSKETINIRDMEYNNFILRSHEFPFTIGNETYQEVVGHEGRVDGNDKWCIELFENE